MRTCDTLPHGHPVREVRYLMRRPGSVGGSPRSPRPASGWETPEAGQATAPGRQVATEDEMETPEKKFPVSMSVSVHHVECLELRRISYLEAEWFELRADGEKLATIHGIGRKLPAFERTEEAPL
jgi:hypothetical protein